MFRFSSQPRRAVTALAATAGALCLAATMTPSGAQATVLQAAGNVSPWAYQAGGGTNTFTVDQAVAQAQKFDIIAGNRLTYRNASAAMHTANPNLNLLAYVNGAYAQKSEGTAYPDSWYLRTRSGAKVRSNGWGNYLMNVANDGWIHDVANRCLQSINNYGYDGCFIDMMGTASVMDFWTSGAPINPATGQEYTVQEWLGLTSALSAEVHTLVGSSTPVYVNGLGAGPRYFAAQGPTSQLLAGIDGALAESWMRGGEQPLSYFPSEKQWLQNVDMLTDVSARGKTALVTVKTWGAGTADQVRAWHVYSLASFLMASDGRSQYSFLPTRNDTTSGDSLLTSLHIGVPTGAYAKVGGVYQRTFTNGRVLVNPTKVTVTVPLDKTYTTTSGNAVQSVTLTPNDAEILTAS
ncbi:MAG: hypothetical protein QOK15_1009 [Nocardioidaceae bacterium]|nr:hypothetical protein [Nocardioidaceae bacterium]